MTCALKNSKEYLDYKSKYGEVTAHHLYVNESNLTASSPIEGGLANFRSIEMEVGQNLSAYQDRYGDLPATQIAVAILNKVPPRSAETPKFGSVLEDLASRFGIPYEVYSDINDARRGYYANENGSRRVYVNTAHATNDTPFHEYFHPFVRALKVENPNLFANLAVYAQNTNNIEDAEEALTQFLGEAAVRRKPSSYLNKFIDFVKSFFLKNYKVNLSDLSPYTKMKVILDILAGKVEITDNTLTTANQLVNQILTGIDGKFKNRAGERVDVDSIKLLQEQATKLTTSDESNYYLDENGNKVGMRMTYFVGDRESGVFSVRYKGKQLLSDREIALRKFAQAGLREDANIVVDNGKLSLTLDEYTEYISTSRSENRIIGKAQHAYLAHLTETDPARKNILLQEALLYAKQLGASTIDEVKQLTIIKNDYLSILKLAGITPQEISGPNVIPDTFFPELTLASELLLTPEGLPLVTTADGLIRHPNGELTLVDYKTGNIVSDIDVNTLMAYSKDLNITDSKLNKAYLELALRAILIKEKLPNAKFRAIKIIKIDNSESANHKAFDLDLGPFLKLAENYYMKEHPAAYKKLVEKNLFSEEEYIGLNSQIVKYQAVLGKLPYPQRLQWVENKINELTLGKSKETIDAESDVIKKQRAALAELRLELSKMPGTSLQGDTGDIDRFLGSIKNMSDISDPKFQVFHQQLLEAKSEAKKEYDEYAEKEAKLLAEVLKEVGANDGRGVTMGNIIKTVLIGGAAIAGNIFFAAGTAIVSSIITRNFKKSPKDVFDFMWTKKEDGDYLNNSDVYLSNSGMKTLSAAQRAYRDFIKASLAEVYSSTMRAPSHLSASGRKQISKAEASGLPTELPSDFLPRIPKQVDEIRLEESYTANLFGIRTRVKNWTKRTLSNFIEGNYYSEDKGGIPVKYYAHYGSQNVQSANHSYNVHDAFRKFTGNMITKKYMDDMYTLAEGLKNIYELSTDEAGRKDKDNLAKFVDDTIHNQILKRPKEIRFKKSPIILPPNKFFGNDSPIEINQDKLLRVLKSGVSYSVMGFKVVGAAFNAGLITITNAMNSTKYVWAAIAGVDPEDVKVSKGAVTFGFAAYADYLKNSMLGTPEKSKIWNIAKKFDWMPDNYGYGDNKEDLLYDTTQKGLSSFAFMFHNYVESYGALTHLGIMMNSIKVDTADGKKKLWDLYDREGNWTGGDRGKVEVAPGEFKTLNELDTFEIKNLKRAYEKLHGSYRQEEKTALEVTVLGEFLIQFKKFFYTYMKTLYASPYKDTTVGRYVLNKNINRPDGVPVFKWEEEVMQGRLSVLTSGFLAAQGIDKVLLGLRGKEYYGTRGNRTLEQTNRVSRLVELANTAMWFAMLLLIYSAAFDDDDDDTYAAFRFRRLVEDSSLGLLPKDVLSTIEKPIVAADRVSKIGKAFFEFASLKKTSEGTYKGSKTLLSSVPILGNPNAILDLFDSKKTSEDGLIFGLIPSSTTSR